MDGPRLAPRPSSAANRSSQSPIEGSPISTLIVLIKAQEGFSHHPPVSQVPVTNKVYFTKTPNSMNSDVPGSSSVVGLPLASGVNGYSSSVVLPGGSGYGSPLSTSPLGIALSLIDKDCPKVTILPTNASGLDLTHVCSFHNYDVYSLLLEDFGELKDIWKLCLIGKTPGYTILGKFMANKLNSGPEGTFIPGMIKRASASPLRYSAEDTGHPSGHCCPNPGASSLAGNTPCFGCKGLPSDVVHGIPSRKSQRKSCLKIVTYTPIAAFGHVGILGFLVADYALLWFRIVYVGIYVSKELVPCFCIDLIYL
ncbi:hypothetical protein D5086_023245 [Populus alba]|uniref:Uncharacterized protein n=1 Tax=Populus alba TaxID=43335 RepID=A0ACC4B978_POPAL